MLRFLYATDLHGDISKYNALLNFAINQNIKNIHLGADLLPKGSEILKAQKKFINGYLKKFYNKSKDNGIEVVAFFGNDDLYTRKKYFRKYGHLLDETPFNKEGYEFKAYPYVQDYPWGLKSACKLDSWGWKCPDAYISKPVDVGDQGFVEIQDINFYFRDKGTIEEDLQKIHATDRTIMAIHQPPWGLDLDVCLNNRRVGSKAVYDWIEREKPAVVLCGHIHESFDITHVWKAKIGQTVVIQSGQFSPNISNVRCVLITMEQSNISTEIIELPTRTI